MPSVLIELGYISNSNEEQYMKSQSGQNSLANSIYLGFKEYKREYDKKSYVFSNAPATQSSENNTPAETAVENPQESDTEYRIQILTSSEQLAPNSKHFKGLSPVDFYKDGTIYKYTYGKSTDPNEIKKTLQRLKKKFFGAFIIEFKNGQRVK